MINNATDFTLPIEMFCRLCQEIWLVVSGNTNKADLTVPVFLAVGRRKACALYVEGELFLKFIED